MVKMAKMSNWRRVVELAPNWPNWHEPGFNRLGPFVGPFGFLALVSHAGLDSCVMKDAEKL